MKLFVDMSYERKKTTSLRNADVDRLTAKSWGKTLDGEPRCCAVSTPRRRSIFSEERDLTGLSLDGMQV